MRVEKIGIFSVILASICCVGPLILVLIGLGSLGIGAMIGKYHWWFLAGAVLLIVVAWGAYFKEKKACDLRICKMENKQTTQIILIIVTLIVAVFAGLNLYTYLGKSTDTTKTSAIVNRETVIIPVEGMSCFTCEVTVISALKKVDGVVDASASAKEKSAKVIYDSDKTNINNLVEAINKTGYKASPPGEVKNNGKI